MFANHRAKTVIGIFMALLLLGVSSAEDKPAKGKSDFEKLQGVWAEGDQVWIINGDEILEYRTLGGISMKPPTARTGWSINPHQSFPSTSPPLGVTAAQYVVAEIPGDTIRLLPSASATRMPPRWVLWGCHGLHSLSLGATWNGDHMRELVETGGEPVVMG